MSSIECRIWKNSLIIGKTVAWINKQYKGSVLKVSRGINASDGLRLKIEEADYIKFKGSNDDLLRFLHDSGDVGNVKSKR